MGMATTSRSSTNRGLSYLASSEVNSLSNFCQTGVSRPLPNSWPGMLMKAPSHASDLIQALHLYLVSGPSAPLTEFART